MEIPTLEIPLVDTHAHLHMKHFEHDRPEVYERTRNLAFVLNVSTSMRDLWATLKVSDELPNCYAALGVHPHDSKDVGRDYLDVLATMAKRGRVVAIGEIGLDFFRNFSPREVQEKVFAEQLMLADELGLPVILHIRDAHAEVYDIIEAVGAPRRGGIVHAFSGDSGWAKKFVDLGFLIGIGGPLTYPKNESLRETVKIIGVGNTVTETDCPYLPPQEYRGKRNEPVFVYYVLKALSEIVGSDVRSVAETVLENVKKLFRLDASFGAGVDA